MNKEKLREEIEGLVFFIEAAEYSSATDSIMQLIEKHMEEEDD